MKPFPAPDPEAIARVRALMERTLGVEEFRAALALPLGEDELEETRSLVRWFRKRYPTPADIDEAQRYAASIAEDETIELAG